MADYSFEVPESKLQEARDDLNKKGYKECLRPGIITHLEPGEYRITPRFSEHQVGLGITSEQGEKLYSVAVQTK